MTETKQNLISTMSEEFVRKQTLSNINWGINESMDDQNRHLGSCIGMGLAAIVGLLGLAIAVQKNVPYHPAMIGLGVASGLSTAYSALHKICFNLARNREEYLLNLEEAI